MELLLTPNDSFFIKIIPGSPNEINIVYTFMSRDPVTKSCKHEEYHLNFEEDDFKVWVDFLHSYRKNKL